jgi:glutathione S-transferase
MTIEISAFRWVPPFAQGYVKDLRIRWALEEAGLPYRAVLIGPADQASDAYRNWQPFGQVPAYRDGTVELFESGAILLHLAAGSEALAPPGPAGQARVAAWVIAALNSVEPFSRYYLEAHDTPGELARRPQVEALLVQRLEALAAALGDKEYFETRFTAGDLIMTTVLRELVESGLLGRFPSLDAHRHRCEARPAFSRALEAQLQVYRENAPT